MHDPYTLIGSFLCFDLWHKDPEHDGDDNSCGWISPNLTDREIDNLQKLANELLDISYKYAMHNWEPNCFNIIYSSYNSVLWELCRKKMNARHLEECLSLISNPLDNLCSYTDLSNRKEYERLLLLIARQIKRIERPFWKHPRYHVHHWRVRVHFSSFNYWLKGVKDRWLT